MVSGIAPWCPVLEMEVLVSGDPGGYALSAVEVWDRKSAIGAVLSRVLHMGVRIVLETCMRQPTARPQTAQVTHMTIYCYILLIQFIS